MGQKKVAKKVKEITNGVLGTAVDLMLISIYYGFEFAFTGCGAKGRGADEKAVNALSELNYQTTKRSFYYLRQKGLANKVKQNITEAFILPTITQEGKEKINSIIPKYKEKRTWDGRVYLITYDIPVDKNRDRDRLRKFMKKIGCGMMQKSVWVTPYNPRRIIEEFVKDTNLSDELIMVSSLKKDGTMGNLSLPELIEQVYKLDDINERYVNFISLVESGQLSTREEIIFSYLSILGVDPQIPFKLLPYGWKGEKAYRIFQKHVVR
jgi:CRISPR-associated endonuclease Cas2